MGTVIAALNIDKSLVINSESKINAGENLTTTLLISIPSSLRDYDYYLEFLCPDNKCIATNKLELAEGSIVFPLPYEIIRKSGRVDIQAVARLDSSDTLIFKSSKAFVYIEESINADTLLVDEFTDVIINCEKAAWLAQDAADNCSVAENLASIAASSADIAASSALTAADNANAKALQATSEATAANSAASACNTAKNRADLATDNAIAATNLVTSKITEAEEKIAEVNTAINNAVLSADWANSAAACANTAANAANQAAGFANTATDYANQAAASANTAAISAESSAAAADLATDSVNSVIYTANNSIASADIAAENANAAAASANAAESSANDAALSANTAKELADAAATAANAAAVSADTAAVSANDATTNAVTAADAAASETLKMETLYQKVFSDVENGVYLGKSAYENATEGGFTGTESEFNQALSKASEYVTEDYGMLNYSNVMKDSFDCKNVPVTSCRENTAVRNLRIYPSKTIPVLPEEYNPSFITPLDNNLVITVHNAADGNPLKSLSIPTPHPLSAIEGSIDEIVWNEAESRYEIIYRNSIIDFTIYNWVWLSTARNQENTYMYAMVNFPKTIAYPDMNYECGSLKRTFGIYINDNDAPMISLDCSEGMYCSMRLAKSLFTDPNDINTFLQENRHHMIFKMKNVITVPLDAELSEELRNIMLYCPDTYIKASTADNVYMIAGDYILDSKSYIDTKAKLSGGNEYLGDQDIQGSISVTGNQSIIGNQSVSGNVNIGGDISICADNLTLRSNKTASLDNYEKIGMVFKSVNGEKDGKLMIDKDGYIYAGLDGKLRNIAERTYAPYDKGITYWNATEGFIATLSNFVITDLIKMRITDDIVLSASGWVSAEGKMKFIYYDNAIKESSFVLVSYADSSKEGAEASGVYKYNPIVSKGNLAIIADSVPETDITVKLVIIGAL